MKSKQILCRFQVRTGLIMEYTGSIALELSFPDIS